MIKFENFEVLGMDHALRGMRNPMESWDKSDSHYLYFGEDKLPQYVICRNDLELASRLAKAGSDHAKYRRMIAVYVDITAPAYWWKEFDTYKVGTVANSTSTMHKIQDKEFTLNDFSHEHLTQESIDDLKYVISRLNYWRNQFLKTGDKNDWWQLIQLLPFSYHYRRTVMVNYEVLSNIYRTRKGHKLDEWREFCKWVEKLPYAYELVC